MTNDQRHIIKRQTIELKVEGPAQAQQLQAEISRIYRRRIVPLIDEYCTELSDPGLVHRIDLLEIDLGAIDPQRLEENFVAKISVALHKALASQINEQEQEVAKHRKINLKARSQLELFAFFARTGNLPWWADTARPQLLEECLQHLIQAMPDSLRRLMGELVLQERPLLRIVVHYGDKLLANLSALLAPSLNHSLASEPQQLSLLIQKSKAANGKQSSWLKQHIWRNILYILGGAQISTADSFYQAVLTQMAAELGSTYESLLAAIHHVLPEAGELARSRLKNILETLYRQQAERTEAQHSELARLFQLAIQQAGSNAKNLPPDDAPRPEQGNSTQSIQRYVAARSVATRENALNLPPLASGTQSVQRRVAAESLDTKRDAQPATHLPTTDVRRDDLWAILESFIAPLPVPLQEKLRGMFQGFTNRPAGEKTISAAALQDILRLLRPIFFHPDSNVLNLPPDDAPRPEQGNGTQSMQRHVATRSVREKKVYPGSNAKNLPPDDAPPPEQANDTQSVQKRVAARSLDEKRDKSAQPATQLPTTDVRRDDLWAILESFIAPLPVPLQEKLRGMFQGFTNR
ncbi:MAG: hypothetical protein GY862_35800, partial [Gammaproteobacteria bacterium]|nr:hypothetical protein [Gammaproteobacteria bacterium]